MGGSFLHIVSLSESENVLCLVLVIYRRWELHPPTTFLFALPKIQLGERAPRQIVPKSAIPHAAAAVTGGRPLRQPLLTLSTPPKSAWKGGTRETNSQACSSCTICVLTRPTWDHGSHVRETFHSVLITDWRTKRSVLMPLFVILIAVFTETQRPICINIPGAGAVQVQVGWAAPLREPTHQRRRRRRRRRDDALLRFGNLTQPTLFPSFPPCEAASCTQ